MVKLTILGLLAAMVAASRLSPTREELQASFAEAQRFYSSGAWDQALEKYERIAATESPFLDGETVLVTVGDITAPLREVARYQTGNAHLKMAREAQARAGRARDPEETARLEAKASRLYEKAAAFFVETEAASSQPALKALARSQAVSCWYGMKDYPRAIEGARLLIERYPGSKYVINAMYDIGWAWYDQEEYDRSIDAFERLVDRFSSGYRVHRALFQLGEAYVRLGRCSEAIPRYRRLVDSQRIGRMSEREILLMKREKIAGLVDETALELAAKALLRIGMCHAETGDLARAAEAFELVASQFAEERRLAEEAYLRHADMYCGRGDLESCIGVYRRAIEAQRDPFGKARMQLLLANRHFETGAYEEAVREYDRYRNLYESRAAQAGLSVEGAGLQIARAWFRRAEGRPGEEGSDYLRRAEAELRQTLSAYPGSDYETELRFNLALALQLQGADARLEEALALFRGVAAGESGYRGSALFQIARIDHARLRHEEAAAGYRRLVDELGHQPEADMARFELAQVLRDSGEPEAAVERFLQVRPEADLYARSRQEAGQILLLTGEPRRAIEVLRAGLEASEEDRPSQALSRYLLGASYSRLDDHEAALPEFEAAAAGAGPDLEERAAYGRGVTLFRLGRTAEALVDLERDWSEPELRASAPGLLAAAYTSSGRTAEALELYGRLAREAETLPERAELYLAQAEISFREGRYRETAAACRRIVELGLEEEDGPPGGRPYYLGEKALYLLADAGIQGQDAAAAEAAATAGLGRWPRGFYAPDFLLLGGLAALQLDRHEVAVNRLTRLLERHPDHEDAGLARYYLGFAHYNRARFGEAVVHFEDVVERFPHLEVAADARFRLAESQFNLNQFDRARRDYRKVLDDHPSSPLAEDALYNIAWCLANTSTDESGEEMARAFAAYAERYPEGRHLASVRYTLAEMSFNAGDYERAHQLFSRIREEFPGSPAAEEAGAVLPELREVIAFQEYSAAMERFDRAIDAEDDGQLRGSLAPLEEVWSRYPDTPGGVAAKVNAGVCLQRLKEWDRAVAVFQEIIDEGEAGNPQVTPEVADLARRRRDSIVRKHL